MLGIGQISTRIAELIRGTLPFAIVDNNPDASMFARLASYSEVQQAVDAGHLWIKVRPSDTDYAHFTADNDYTKIESSWGARFTNINTAASNHVIVVSGNHCTMTGLRTYTAGGATSNDRRGFNITGQYIQVSNCFVEDSDGSGFAIEGSYNLFQNCLVKDADDYGFYMNSNFVQILNCRMVTSGSGPIHFTTVGDASIVVGCLVQDTGNIGVASTAVDGVIVGNAINGGISISTSDAWILGSNTAAAGDPPGANKLY